ncbi:nicolin-1 isoform X3 [Scyliorhinus torazame]|uniref:nicolin-1 isoform X3 n=1 Tax=Scyliorhinus torazame TaxID=75743 RepID=UPI003B5B6815
MADESIACIIKSPIALQAGDVKTDLAKPGVFVIEVTFPRERIVNMLFEPDDVMTVRLILRQPSPVWLTFTIEDIKMYECDHDKDKVQGPWLSQLTPPERPLNLSDGLPDPEVVASSVQQMWVLTEMVRNNPTSNRVGRFDVDGSYDVTLLSYT